MSLVRLVTLFVVILTAVARFFIEQPGVDKADFFKDWGHLLVGYLIGAAVLSYYHKVGRWKFYGSSAAILTAAEVIAAVLSI